MAAEARTAMALRARIIHQVEALRRDRTSYISACLKIKTKDNQLVKLVPNVAQRKLLGALEAQRAAGRPQRVIVLKARQVGISTISEATLFHHTATEEYRLGVIVADSTENARELFEMTRLMYEELPSVVKPLRRYTNRQELWFENPREAERAYRPGLRSRLLVGTAGNVRVGRSKTIHALHCSEVAFWANPKKALLAVLNAVPDHPDTIVVLESTANGVGGEFYERWWAAKEGRSEYAPVFVAWWEFPEYERPFGSPEERAAFAAELDAEEQELQAAYGLRLDQLHWRRWTIANKCGGDVELFRQEYPANDVEAFLVSGRPVFDRRQLTRQLATATDGVRGNLIETPAGIQFAPNPDGYLTVWRVPRPGRAYAIGADVAEGVPGGAFSSADVLDRETLEQVAHWHGHLGPDLLAVQLDRLGRWYQIAALGPEVNNHGLTTVVKLQELKYPRLYRRRRFNRKRNAYEWADGWATTPTTRPKLVDDLAAVIRDGEIRIRSRDTIRECLSFVYDDSGDPGPQPGTYADRVISLAVAVQVHRHSPMPVAAPKGQPRIRRDPTTGW